MANQNDIENIVKMLDAKTGAGISRIKIDISDENENGTITEETHYGRCDIKGECVLEITKNVKES